MSGGMLSPVAIIEQDEIESPQFKKLANHFKTMEKNTPNPAFEIGQIKESPNYKLQKDLDAINPFGTQSYEDKFDKLNEKHAYNQSPDIIRTAESPQESLDDSLDQEVTNINLNQSSGSDHQSENVFNVQLMEQLKLPLSVNIDIDKIAIEVKSNIPIIGQDRVDSDSSDDNLQVQFLEHKCDNNDHNHHHSQIKYHHHLGMDRVSSDSSDCEIKNQFLHDECNFEQSVDCIRYELGTDRVPSDNSDNDLQKQFLCFDVDCNNLNEHEHFQESTVENISVNQIHENLILTPKGKMMTEKYKFKQLNTHQTKLESAFKSIQKQGDDSQIKKSPLQHNNFSQPDQSQQKDNGPSTVQKEIRTTDTNELINVLDQNNNAGKLNSANELEKVIERNDQLLIQENGYLQSDQQFSGEETDYVSPELKVESTIENDEFAAINAITNSSQRKRKIEKFNTKLSKIERQLTQDNQQRIFEEIGGAGLDRMAQVQDLNIRDRFNFKKLFNYLEDIQKVKNIKGPKHIQRFLPDFPQESILRTFIEEFKVFQDLPTNCKKQILSECLPLRYNLQERILRIDQSNNISIGSEVYKQNLEQETGMFMVCAGEVLLLRNQKVYDQFLKHEERFAEERITKSSISENVSYGAFSKVGWVLTNYILKQQNLMEVINKKVQEQGVKKLVGSLKKEIMGRETIIKGETFGDFGLLKTRAYKQQYAIAISSETQILFLSKAKLRSILSVNPENMKIIREKIPQIITNTPIIQKKIVRCFEEVYFSPGQIIIKENELAHNMYLIKKGTCEIRSTIFNEDKKQIQSIVIHEIGSHEWFGEEYLYQEPYQAHLTPDEYDTGVNKQSITAKSHVIALVINRTDVKKRIPRDYLKTLKTLALQKQEFIANRVDTVKKDLLNLKYLDTFKRHYESKYKSIKTLYPYIPEKMIDKLGYGDGQTHKRHHSRVKEVINIGQFQIVNNIDPINNSPTNKLMQIQQSDIPKPNCFEVPLENEIIIDIVQKQQKQDALKNEIEKLQNIKTQNRIMKEKREQQQKFLDSKTLKQQEKEKIMLESEDYQKNLIIANKKNEAACGKICSNLENDKQQVKHSIAVIKHAATQKIQTFMSSNTDFKNQKQSSTMRNSQLDQIESPKQSQSSTHYDNFHPFMEVSSRWQGEKFFEVAATKKKNRYSNSPKKVSNVSPGRASLIIPSRKVEISIIDHKSGSLDGLFELEQKEDNFPKHIDAPNNGPTTVNQMHSRIMVGTEPTRIVTTPKSENQVIINISPDGRDSNQNQLKSPPESMDYTNYKNTGAENKQQMVQQVSDYMTNRTSHPTNDYCDSLSQQVNKQHEMPQEMTTVSKNTKVSAIPIYQTQSDLRQIDIFLDRDVNKAEQQFKRNIYKQIQSLKPAINVAQPIQNDNNQEIPEIDIELSRISKSQIRRRQKTRFRQQKEGFDEDFAPSENQGLMLKRFSKLKKSMMESTNQSSNKAYKLNIIDHETQSRARSQPRHNSNIRTQRRQLGISVDFAEIPSRKLQVLDNEAAGTIIVYDMDPSKILNLISPISASSSLGSKLAFTSESVQNNKEQSLTFIKSHQQQQIRNLQNNYKIPQSLKNMDKILNNKNSQQLISQFSEQTYKQEIKLPLISQLWQNNLNLIPYYNPNQFGKFTDKLQQARNRRHQLFQQKNVQEDQKNVKVMKHNASSSVDGMLSRI